MPSFSLAYSRQTLASLLAFALGAAAVGVTGTGCNLMERTTLSVPSIPLNKKTILSNPLVIPTQDSEFLWNQIIDTIEDYFDRNRSEIRPVRDGFNGSKDASKPILKSVPPIWSRGEKMR